MYSDLSCTWFGRCWGELICVCVELVGMGWEIGMEKWDKGVEIWY